MPHNPAAASRPASSTIAQRASTGTGAAAPRPSPAAAGVWLAPPSYCAATWCRPRGRSISQVATASTTGTAAQTTTPSSRKSTVPETGREPVPVTVALSVTGPGAPPPVTEARTACGPAMALAVAVMLAMPLPSVVAEAADSTAAAPSGPGSALNATVTPDSATPPASVTRTDSGAAKAEPAGVLCASPLSITTEPGAFCANATVTL